MSNGQLMYIQEYFRKYLVRFSFYCESRVLCNKSSGLDSLTGKCGNFRSISLTSLQQPPSNHAP